jgi:hypothetical protein
MKTSAPSISDLLARLTQLEDRTAKAEERAARAEARADRLESATGHLAAAVVNPKPISRRNLLTKAAAVGAAGVAGSLLLNRKEASASFTWQGGASNAADTVTTVTANSGFSELAVLMLDANQTSNSAANIDGLASTGTGIFAGVSGLGGNKGGPAFYGQGGNGVVGVNDAGSAIFGISGNNVSGGFSSAAHFSGSGADDGTAFGYGTVSIGAGNGPGGYFTGGDGTTALPATNGGNGIFALAGPGAAGGFFAGDALDSNPAIAADGVVANGNALGVGARLHGGRAQLSLDPAGGVGAPTAGLHVAGDVYMDANKVIWVCITGGTPGAFVPLQLGGINNALFTAVSTLQYHLLGNNGTLWTDMDSTNLKLTITPLYNCQAIFTASADLFTGDAGYNQDIGISISGAPYPTVAGQPESWKESGGFAGTFSPNAAHVDTVVPLTVGVAYTIKVVWKTNKPAAGKTIYAGAGPIGGKHSPTRLTGWLVPTNPGGLIPRTPSKPYVRDIPKLKMPAVPSRARTHK